MAGKRGQRTRAKRAKTETSEKDLEALVRGLEGEHEQRRAGEALLRPLLAPGFFFARLSYIMEKAFLKS